MKENKTIEKNLIKKEEFSPEGLDNIREKTITAFFSAFSSAGYKNHPPETSLISKVDQSVTFIGAATNVFKKYLYNPEQLPQEGYFMLQKCLRTRNMKTLFEDSVIPEWSSYFEIMGAMAKPDKTEDLSKATMQFLSQLDIAPERIRIHVSSKDTDLLEIAQNMSATYKCAIEIDGAQDLNYYRHKFGMEQEGVFGRNFNIAIKNEQSGKFKDIGNVIIIEENGSPIAVEMGIGVSTLIARKFSKNNSIECSGISKIIPFKPDLTVKFADTLVVAIVMYKENIRPGAAHKNHLLRTNMVALNYFKEKLGLSFEEIEKFIEEYEKEEFGEITDVGKEMVGYLKEKSKKEENTSYDIDWGKNKRRGL